jgi:hypothetical protein
VVTRSGGTVTEPVGDRNVKSIQGEQQESTGGYVRASDEDVDLYVDRVSDAVIACRERGRHLFPTIRQAGIRFTDVDRDGLLVRRLTCTCCDLAVKVEKWEGVRDRGRTRFARVASTLEYRTGDNGEIYLAPSGRGHMTPRQIGDSVASKALSGQTLTQLRKDARAAAAATKESAAKGTAKPAAKPAAQAAAPAKGAKRTRRTTAATGGE